VNARVHQTPEVSIERRPDLSVSVLRLSGEIDLRIHNELRRVLWHEVDSGHDLILDLTQVEFVDSTALGLFVGALKRARMLHAPRKPSVILVIADSHTERVLNITNLDRLFTIVSTVEDAECLI
jgi:anti-sigma B factor antagonist